MINRAALILKYKEPAIKWINDADPAGNPGVSFEDTNRERTIYLIGDEVADSEVSLERWLKANYKNLFEMELDGWYCDPSLWPSKLTYALFKKWFTVECHTVIEDTVGGPIVDDEVDF